ncbi:MAG: UDP-N-acetylmuramate--L-alanine ligase [Propionibacteriaceae bacterium]|jgi:UDP-N-acetylmuramate--alanine ligase|nr:UDP-N-acetylmuramate--L-alanine ligase [Propionibacteriaceae bacterium]
MTLVEPVELAAPDELGRVHFIAVGGAGMGPIAKLYAESGLAVTGCDRAPDSLGALAQAGVGVSLGHDPSHLEGVDTVVYSSAVRESNPELAAARQRGLRVWHRSAGLAALMIGQTGIAVSGTHGKTTTSGMLAHALTQLGADPSYVIGSPLQGGSDHRLGGGGAFVVEADESDGSFLQYPAQIVVVTNIEADHLDNWGTPQAYRAGFAKFANQPAVAEVVVPPELVGLVRPGGPRVHRFTAPEEPYELLAVGQHNQRNAAAAFAVCHDVLGFDADRVRAALATYRGTRRRMELVAEVGGVKVYDDYAHHPTEVAATLAAARSLPHKRLVVCFQPHLFTRTRDFAAEFAQVLSAADLAVVLDVYPAREDPIEGVTGRLVADRVPQGAVYAETLDQAVDELARLARPGDLVITMGAGSVTGIGPRLAAALSGGHG